jgi:hypothetical protein
MAGAVVIINWTVKMVVIKLQYQEFAVALEELSIDQASCRSQLLYIITIL